MEVLEKDPMLYKVVRPLAKAIFKVLYRPTIIGAENIPKERHLYCLCEFAIFERNYQ